MLEKVPPTSASHNANALRPGGIPIQPSATENENSRPKSNSCC